MYDFVMEDYNKARTKLEEVTNFDMKNFCLCHGWLGNFLILRYLQQEETNINKEKQVLPDVLCLD